MDSVATRPALLLYVRVKNRFCNNNKAKDSLTIFLYTRGFASRNEKDEDEGEEETRPDGYPSRVRVGRGSDEIDQGGSWAGAVTSKSPVNAKKAKCYRRTEGRTDRPSRLKSRVHATKNEK